MSEKKQAVAMSLLVVGLIALLVFLLIINNNINIANEKKCYENRPSEEFVEEDLERQLISKSLDVYDTDFSEYGFAVYYVSDYSTNKNYKCAYEVVGIQSIDTVKRYKWKFVTYVEI